MERELSEGYEALHVRAKMLLQETRDLQEQGGVTSEPNSHIQDIKPLTEGRISAFVAARPLFSV